MVDEEVGHWSVHTSKHGVPCHVIDESITVPRKAPWSSVLVASILRIKHRQVLIGTTHIAYTELKSVEQPRKSDIPKIIHEGGAKVLSRVIALRYEWTRSKSCTVHVSFLLMPTCVEAEMTLRGLNAIRVSGLDACQRWALQDADKIPPHLVRRSRETSKHMRSTVRGMSRAGALEEMRRTMLSPHTTPRVSSIDAEELGAQNMVDWLPIDTPQLHELWESFDEWQDDQVRRVAGTQGMPLKYRFSLWPKWLHADKKMVTREEAERGVEGEVLREDAPADAVHQIDLDLHRTFPGLVLDIHREGLRHVLVAFAAENPAIGYCQSMNMIAALFLVLGFDISSTYQMFSTTILTICVNYHAVDFGGLLRDSAVIDALLSHFYPRAHQILSLASIPALHFAGEILLTMCTKDWPLQFAIRVWDLIFIHGVSALLCTVLVALDTFLPKESDGENACDSGDLMMRFRDRVICGLENEKVVSRVLDRIRTAIEHVPQSMIDDLRAKMDT